jgi:hypothetical protein
MKEGEETIQKGGDDEDCFGASEEVYFKLQLLNYEKTLLGNKGLKPLTPSYFAVSLNQSEQFNYFKKYSPPLGFPLKTRLFWGKTAFPSGF